MKIRKLTSTAMAVLLVILLCSCSAPKGSGISTDSDGILKAASENSESETTQDTQTGNASNVGIEVGMIAPDFEIISLNGESEGTLSDLRGKPVLLNFWATWCGPCVKEMPDIEKIYRQYKNDISIIAVSVGEKPDVVKDFLGEHQFTFPIGLDEKNEIAASYRIQTIPRTIFLNEDGVITEVIEYSANESIFKESIESMLEENNAQ